MPAQNVLVVAIPYELFADKSNDATYRTILNFFFGTMMPVIWIEKVIIYKRIRADYLT